MSQLSTQAQQARSIVFTVPDMMCGTCGKKIIAAVTALDGVAVVTADPETKRVEVLTRCEEGLVKGAIEGVGFEVMPTHS